MFSKCLLIKFSLALFFVFSVSAFQQAHSNSDDPIAYTGHGIIFDQNGKEIKVTPEFVKQALQFYLDTLLKQANDKQRRLFEEKKKKLFNQRWDIRSELYTNSALLEWLIKEVNPSGAVEMAGKIKLLQQKLMSPSLFIAPSTKDNDEKPFEIPAELKKLLDSEVISKLNGKNITTLSTNLSGAAYIAQCNSAGVPTPPDWGTGDWVNKGSLTTNFLKDPNVPQVAEVFTFKSNSPEGMCIALPRSNGSTISLLGIICLGKFSSNACFWDNQKDADNDGVSFSFPIQKGDVVPISQFAGGAELVKGSESGPGICTSCHAGENPYIIHPNTALGLPSLTGLPTRADNWYKPLIHPSWPQNVGPTNILDSVSSPGKCTDCHTKTGGGGRFPRLSTEIKGFCGTILPRARERTMPLGNPNDPNYAAHFNALDAACKTDPDADKDGIDDFFDNCPSIANPDQLDTDFDQQGDACDTDDDDDGCTDVEDQHPKQGSVQIGTYTSATCNPRNGPVFGKESTDSDHDGLLNCKDPDDDNDGLLDGADQCATVKGKCPLILKDCGVQVPWDVCRGGNCAKLFLRLVYAVNPPTVTPQIDITIFNRFWIEDGAIYISPAKIDEQKNATQTIIRQLSTVPDTATAGRLRLEIWSRQAHDSAQHLRAVVSEYDPSQVVLGQVLRGATVRLEPPLTPGSDMLIETSEKTEPAMENGKVQNGNTASFWAILVFIIIAILVTVAIKK